MNMENELLELLRELKGKDFDKVSNLTTDGYIDSLDMVQYVNLIEDYYNICLPLERIDLYTFNSIESIMALVEECMNNG